MLALGACAGLRRAEIATCRGDALERDLDGWSLRVLGKGGRVRRVPLTDDMADQISARGQGWTFQGQVSGGQAVLGDRTAGHLSAGRVGELVSELLPNLGHVSVATTQVYTAVPDDAKRRAARAASLAA